MDFTRWQTIKMLQNPSKRLGAPEAATPATDRWAQGAGRHHQAGSRPRPALTPRLGTPTRVARTRGADAVEAVAVSLTGNSNGGEQQRRSGATSMGGGGRTGAAAGGGPVRRRRRPG